MARGSLPVGISFPFGSHLVPRRPWGQAQPLAPGVRQAGAFFQDFLAKRLLRVLSQQDLTQHRALRSRRLGSTLAHFLSCCCLMPDKTIFWLAEKQW